MAFQIDARMEQRTDHLSHPTTLFSPSSENGRRAASHQPPPPILAPIEVEPILRELEQGAAFLHRKLKFSVNKDLNRVIIKVFDAETDKLIKELPPEEMQRVSVRIREAVGLLIDEEI